MRANIHCCDCGTDLICCDSNAETKLSLCHGCWLRVPSAVIVERSKAHDREGHASDQASKLRRGR